MSKQKKKKNWFRLYFLHRYIGLASALFTVLLSVTGILLNHTEELELSKQSVSSSWLMSLYGIETPQIKQSYSLDSSSNDNQTPSINNERWVAEFGDSIFLNNQKLDCPPPLTGAMATKDFLIVSTQTRVCLFTQETELVDILTSPSFDSELQYKRMGGDINGNIVFDTSAGLVAVNPEYTELTPLSTDQKEVKWLTSSQAPDKVKDKLKNQYSGKGLPLERIILDLHSGRILSIAGVYFMDFVALLLIFLAFSGVITWANRNKKKRQKNNK